jgi:hypothetical protein
MALRGELSEVYDLTVFRAPWSSGSGCLGHVLAGVSFPCFVRAVCSRLSMTWSHIEHGCSLIYFGFSQRQTTVSTQLSFFKTLHLQSSFSGSTISCLLGKQPQEVHKSDRWLKVLCCSQGLAELDQCVVIQKSRSDGYRVRLSWGISGAIPTHYLYSGSM